jgi:hypothetical protein
VLLAAIADYCKRMWPNWPVIASVNVVEIRGGSEVAIGHAAWGGIWAVSGSVAGIVSSAMASTCM